MRSMSDDQREWLNAVEALRASGMTLAAIGLQYGISRQAVHNRIKNLRRCRARAQNRA